MSSSFAVPKQDFMQGNKKSLSLVTVYSALNLFLNEYVAEIQLSGNGIWLLSIPQRFYTGF
jgi:hypothetical protein